MSSWIAHAAESVEFYAIERNRDRCVVRWMSDEATADEAIADVLTESPATMTYQTRVLDRNGIRIAEVVNSLWSIDVEYVAQVLQNNPTPETGTVVQEWAGVPVFSVAHNSGGPITHSIATIAKYPNDAIDFGQAINVVWHHGELVTKGLRMTTPRPNLKLKHYVAIDDVDQTYVNNVCASLGHVNSTTIRGFPAGTLFLSMVTGAQRNAFDYLIEYHFATARNKVAIQVGSISGIAKKGHEYLWVFERTEREAGGVKKLKKVPVGVYVEQIFPTYDFSTLGL